MLISSGRISSRRHACNSRAHNLQTAADYLAAWCGDEQLLLKKLYSDQVEEPVFELTSGAERVMQWIEDLQAKPFVSAESRLELILRNLEEIVLFSTSDVEKRLSALKEQQAAYTSANRRNGIE